MSLSNFYVNQAIENALRTIAMRDEFAAAALQGFIANQGTDVVMVAEHPELAASHMYVIADAMLKARTA